MKDKNFKIVDGEVSDGYHTFSELYNHRNLLFINLCLKDPKNSWWKPDYENYFCLYLESPIGQISYHMGDELLSLIEGKIEKCLDRIWDGHSNADVISRLGYNAINIINEPV